MELFNRQGEVKAPAGHDDKGRPFYRYKSICGRCSNMGGPGWHPSGLAEGRCYQCGGHGGPVKSAPLYTADQLAKLNERKGRADAKKQAKRDALAAVAKAEADGRREAFEAANGEVLAWARAHAEGNEFLTSLVSQADRKAELSDAQLASLYSARSRALSAEVKRAASGHVGNVGDRVTLRVRVERVTSFFRPAFSGYGRDEQVPVVTMRDDAGNAIVTMTPAFVAAPGEAFTLKGTVKAHKEYKGEKQTLLQRPKDSDYTAEVPEEFRREAIWGWKE